MNEIITIENTEMQIKEYNGQRVVTFKDIDAVHQRPSGTAYRNFRTNKKHFIEGEDFIRICVDEIRRCKIMDISAKARADITLITESGYLMLVKSFTDDLSWSVQRQLVNAYFKVKKSTSSYTMEEHKVSSVPAPKNTSWYRKNKCKIDYICKKKRLHEEKVIPFCLIETGRGLRFREVKTNLRRRKWMRTRICNEYCRLLS